MIKCIVSSVLLLSLAIAGSPVVQGAGVDILKDKIWIRVGENNYEVEFAVAAGDLVWFNNGIDCTTGHETSKGAKTRYYEHCHVGYSLPVSGTVVTGGSGTMTVTDLRIRAYEDWVRASFTGAGAEDVTVNCHGYAFGIDTWILDPAYIDADDYMPASGWSDATVLRGEGKAHTIKIDAYDTKYFNEVDTSEKNGASRIYKKHFTLLFGSPDGSGVKKKPKP